MKKELCLVLVSSLFLIICLSFVYAGQSKNAEKLVNCALKYNKNGALAAKDYCGGTCTYCYWTQLVSGAETYRCGYTTKGNVDFVPKGGKSGCPENWVCDGQGECTTDECHITEAYWTDNIGKKLAAGTEVPEDSDLKMVVKTKKCANGKQITINFNKINKIFFIRLLENDEGIAEASETAKIITSGAEQESLRFKASIPGITNSEKTSYEIIAKKCEIETVSLVKEVETVAGKPPIVRPLSDFECIKPGAKVGVGVGAPNCKDGTPVKIRITRINPQVPLKYPDADSPFSGEESVEEGNTEDSQIFEEEKFVKDGKVGPLSVGLDVGDLKGRNIKATAEIPGGNKKESGVIKPCKQNQGDCAEEPGNCLQECDANKNALKKPKPVTTDAPQCHSCIAVYCHKTQGATGLIAPDWLPYPNDKLSCQIKDASGKIQYGTCLAGECKPQDAKTKCSSSSPCKSVCGKDAGGSDTLQKYNCVVGACVASGNPEVKGNKDRCVDGDWVILRMTRESGGADVANMLMDAANSFLIGVATIPIKATTRGNKGLFSYYLKFKYRVPIPLVGGAFYEDKYCDLLRENGAI